MNRKARPVDPPADPAPTPVRSRLAVADPAACYAALCARDARFDGRFFVGVTSTGIYCRPVCRVRTPRAENCRYFAHAAAAEAAGFRPCLRCRPELAPGLSPIDMPQQLAWAAAQRIDAGALDAADLPALAARLGITDRHLRRIFAATWGVSPVAYAQTRRLLAAKRLLSDTDWPVTAVAEAAGFGSLRRFNALFLARYRMSPLALRRRAGAAATEGLLLPYRPPYDWPGLLAYLGERAVPGIEVVDGTAYARTLQLVVGGRRHVGWIRLEAWPGRDALRLSLSSALAPVLPVLLVRVRQAFDLDGDPQAVAQRLGALAAEAPGLRLPSGPDGFEMAVRAVLGQQLSLAAARRLTQRLVEALGEPLAEAANGGDTPAGLHALFPEPARLATTGLDRLGELGLIRSRGRAVQALALAVQAGTLDLSPAADPAVTLAALQALPGIGTWTAQTIALTALGWPDAWPSGDRVLLQALSADQALPPGVAGGRQADARAEAWRPWRGYATLHLWRRALAARRAAG